jgi:hypothetical protein
MTMNLTTTMHDGAARSLADAINKQWPDANVSIGPVVDGQAAVAANGLPHRGIVSFIAGWMSGARWQSEQDEAMPAAQENAALSKAAPALLAACKLALLLIPHRLFPDDDPRHGTDPTDTIRAAIAATQEVQP